MKGMGLWFDVEAAALVPDGPEMRLRPTVVLLHGEPGSYDHSYFKPDFARLAEVAQVLYLYLPGHGRSEWGDPATWSFKLAADAVRDFCDAVGIARPIVYGHSLGGMARCSRERATSREGRPGSILAASHRLPDGGAMTNSR